MERGRGGIAEAPRSSSPPWVPPPTVPSRAPCAQQSRPSLAFLPLSVDEKATDQNRRSCKQSEHSQCCRLCLPPASRLLLSAVGQLPLLPGPFPGALRGGLGGLQRRLPAPPPAPHQPSPAQPEGAEAAAVPVAPWGRPPHPQQLRRTLAPQRQPLHHRVAPGPTEAAGAGHEAHGGYGPLTCPGGGRARGRGRPPVSVHRWGHHQEAARGLCWLSPDCGRSPKSRHPPPPQPCFW